MTILIASYYCYLFMQGLFCMVYELGLSCLWPMCRQCSYTYETVEHHLQHCATSRDLRHGLLATLASCLYSNNHKKTIKNVISYHLKLDRVKQGWKKCGTTKSRHCHLCPRAAALCVLRINEWIDTCFDIYPVILLLYVACAIKFTCLLVLSEIYTTSITCILARHVRVLCISYT